MQTIKLALVLASCAPMPHSPRLQTPTPSKPAKVTRTPTRTPSPIIAVRDVVLTSHAGRDEVAVLGLVENLSPDPLSDVEILVQLLDGSDGLIQQQVVPIFLPHLRSGGESPFAVDFSGVDGAVKVQVEPASYASIPVTPVPLQLETWSLTPMVGGGMALLGELENDGELTVALHRVGFSILDTSGDLVGLSPAATHLSLLEPGESTPVAVALEDLAHEHELQPYLDAVATTTKKFPPDLTVQAIWLDRTSQGAPFLLGEISNRGYTATWARLLAVFRHEERLIAAAPIDLPFPIPADEKWPFGTMHIPGLEAALQQDSIELQSLEIEVLIDPYARSEAIGDPQRLQIQVTHFEPIGSTLLIRGSVINPTQKELVSPTVYVALRTTQGDLFSTGWQAMDLRLASQEEAPFTLNLPLPENADVPMSEHDLLAVGFLAPEP